MTLQGYQFDKAKVTPESDAALYSYLAQSSDNKVISGLTVTATGLNVYVASGKALVQGRLIENTQQVQLTAQANKTGYVCITIDLTQTNTSTGTPGTSDYVPFNNQLRLELVESLNRQDLNAGGFVYTFPLYACESSATTVTLTRVDASYLVSDWTPLANYGAYKVSLNQVSINYNITGNGSLFMQFGYLPKHLRPPFDYYLLATNQGNSLADDKHLMIRASDGAVVLWAPKSGTKYMGIVSYTL
ncbi:MAG: hypothetical protein GX453_00450 [Lactococcus chungangensis]|uniref:Uncharacterized protein n=1 Tax=Pseudolactococcus chungangensis TaxID=451457 RepID=A0A847J1K4_9LACT|nr:hypothetical protein [Lactococcus chungangensis]